MITASAQPIGVQPRLACVLAVAGWYRGMRHGVRRSHEGSMGVLRQAHTGLLQGVHSRPHCGTIAL